MPSAKQYKKKKEHKHNENKRKTGKGGGLHRTPKTSEFLDHEIHSTGKQSTYDNPSQHGSLRVNLHISNTYHSNSWYRSTVADKCNQLQILLDEQYRALQPNLFTLSPQKATSELDLSCKLVLIEPNHKAHHIA